MPRRVVGPLGAPGGISVRSRGVFRALRGERLQRRVAERAKVAETFYLTLFRTPWDGLDTRK